MKKLMVFAAAVAMTVGAGFAGAEEAKPAEPQVKYGMNVGDLAKPVKIKTLDGKEASPSDLAKESGGKKSVFVLVNAVCNLCKTEMQDLLKYKDKLAEKGNIYFVAVDMNAEVAKGAYAEYAGAFKMLYDPQFTFGTSVEVYSTPATIVLDKDGKIAYKAEGYRPDSLKKLNEVL